MCPTDIFAAFLRDENRKEYFLQPLGIPIEPKIAMAEGVRPAVTSCFNEVRDVRYEVDISSISAEWVRCLVSDIAFLIGKEVHFEKLSVCRSAIAR